MIENKVFNIIGINHKSNESGTHQKLISKKYPDIIMEELFNEGKISSFVILKTCLRIEVYFVSNDVDTYLTVKNRLLEVIDSVYHYKNNDAVNHLNRVVCGLDSIIIGENQILAQVKKSYLLSLDEKKVDSLINKIFNLAIALGKKFRHNTTLTDAPLTLEKIALNYIKGFIPDLTDKNIFLIGSSDLNKSLIKLFKENHINNIFVANRTMEKSIMLHNEHGLEIVDFADKYKVIEKSDVIISATTAPHLIIKKNEVEKFICDGKLRFFLDLAVPADIDIEIKEISGVVFHNLDDLWKQYQSNKTKKENHHNKYIYLLDEAFDELYRWCTFINRKKYE